MRKKLLFMLMWTMLMTWGMTVSAKEYDLWTNHAADSFAGGMGTADSPYLISNASELALMAKNTNEGSGEGNYYELVADIDLSGYEWDPIGNNSFSDEGGYVQTYENVFSGHFDGNHYTVRNMSIQYADDTKYYYGLFGACDSGVIENLNLDNVTIHIDSVNAGWQAENGMGSEMYIGCIAGEVMAFAGEENDPVITLNNCSVTNADINVKTAMSVTVGGIVGGMNYAGVENCDVEADISVTSGRALFVGGAFGRISNHTSVSNCQSDCQIETVSEGTITEFEHLGEQGLSYAHYAGGFAGCAGRANSNVSIRNCYCEGTLNARLSQQSPDGGMFAGNCGSVYDNSTYENLVSSVIVYNNGVRENYFNKAEGFCYYPSIGDSETVYNHNNLITISDNEAVVYSLREGNQETTNYDLTKETMNSVLRQLGFSAETWCIDSDAVGLRRYVGRNAKIAGASNAEIIYACITCGEILGAQETIPALTKGWIAFGEETYWYENGVKQGTEGRGKEVFDPDSNAWYWLDAVEGGKKTVSKDVYQESEAGQWGDCVGEDGKRYGKWVRYDAEGHMIKGWSESDGNTYYFDEMYGTMAKGYATIDGKEYYFNAVTGALEKEIGSIPENGWKDIDGNAIWYENGVRQGYSVDASYRGKEIFDPDSNAWYWLDNVDGGKKAVSKDVYQESEAGQWGDYVGENGEKCGKWVRYDAEGHMIKGWSESDGNTYYFDEVYGTMAKGTVTIDGQTYIFDTETGILLK